MVLAVSVVEAIMIANDPARLPWEVETEAYTIALLWFALPREIAMLEWVCGQIGERACRLQSDAGHDKRHKCAISSFEGYPPYDVAGPPG